MFIQQVVVSPPHVLGPVGRARNMAVHKTVYNMVFVTLVVWKKWAGKKPDNRTAHSHLEAQVTVSKSSR